MANEKTVRVRFLETRTVKDEEGRTFKAGEVYELSESSARHWISRQVAVTDDAGKSAAKNGGKPAVK